MARTRYLKPAFFEDTELAQVHRDTRMLYAGLWCHMDRNGVTEDDCRLIKRNVYPYDDDITVKRVGELVDELIAHGFLFRVGYQGKDHLYCPKLKEHQLFHKDERPRFNIPPEILAASCKHGAGTVPARTQPSAPNTGNGELVTGTGTETNNDESPAAWRPALSCFEAVWKQYPRRVEKTNAMKRFGEIVQTQEVYELFRLAVNRYASYCKTHQIPEAGTKHMATFLENRDSKPFIQPWRDYLEIPDPDSPTVPTDLPGEAEKARTRQASEEREKAVAGQTPEDRKRILEIAKANKTPEGYFATTPQNPTNLEAQ